MSHPIDDGPNHPYRRVGHFEDGIQSVDFASMARTFLFYMNREAPGLIPRPVDLPSPMRGAFERAMLATFAEFGVPCAEADHASYPSTKEETLRELWLFIVRRARSGGVS